jgi:hypothetical protein
MAISPEDRAKWDRQVAALREAETEEQPSQEILEERVAEANRWREAHGIPPLKDEFEDPPEMEFFRRAKRLGFLGRRG